MEYNIIFKKHGRVLKHGSKSVSGWLLRNARAWYEKQKMHSLLVVIEDNEESKDSVIVRYYGPLVCGDMICMMSFFIHNYKKVGKEFGEAIDYFGFRCH